MEPPPPPEANFKEMLYARFGRGIAERFLIPYNEKLYACDLATLDKDAMGRFFPHADLTDIVRNMRVADNASYNASFTYPRGGAIEYVKAIASASPPGAIALGEALVGVDLRARVARTTKREIRFERLVSSIPFDRLARLTGLAHDAAAFTWNKVLVFNLGFDKKGERGVHWVYYPDRARVFYRAGWYDNIFDTDRLSLYVEVGFPKDAVVDVDATRARVLEDLRAEGVITDHRLVSHHAIVMDPAYVHITRAVDRGAPSPLARRSRRTGCTRSAATADGPTARSKTTSSKRARLPPTSTRRNGRIEGRLTPLLPPPPARSPPRCANPAAHSQAQARARKHSRATRTLTS